MTADSIKLKVGDAVNGQRRDLTTEDILRSIEHTVPLAAIGRIAAN